MRESLRLHSDVFDNVANTDERPMLDARALIAGFTRLRPIPLVAEIQLHVADEIMPLWERIADARNDPDTPPPYWAAVWPGGQALARYLLDHPGEASAKRVLDLGSGSGLCAIAAAQAGACPVVAADIDPLAIAAIQANLRANQVCAAVRLQDALGEEPVDVDMIVAGDVCYEHRLARQVLPWLHRAHRRGIRVLMGDPHRPHFRAGDLVEIASYAVPTPWDLESALEIRTGVFAFAS